VRKDEQLYAHFFLTTADSDHRDHLQIELSLPIFRVDKKNKSSESVVSAEQIPSPSIFFFIKRNLFFDTQTKSVVGYVFNTTFAGQMQRDQLESALEDEKTKWNASDSSNDFSLYIQARKLQLMKPSDD
jgi:hypothetical protein